MSRTYSNFLQVYGKLFYDGFGEHVGGAFYAWMMTEGRVREEPAFGGIPSV